LAVARGAQGTAGTLLTAAAVVAVRRLLVVGLAVQDSGRAER
jgi:hypothetical protein